MTPADATGREHLVGAWRFLLDWRMACGLLILLAVWTIVRIPLLKLEAFPEVSEVQVSVYTEVPGMAAQEIERLVSFPVESVMYALPQVDDVRSVSQAGLSIVTVIFAGGTDVYFARQLVSERLHTASERMPSGFPDPQVGPNIGAQSEVFEYFLRGDDVALDELRALNDWLVRRQLLPVEGVTEVLPFGGKVRQYQLALDPNRMLAHSVSVGQIREAVEQSNLNVGAWFLQKGPEQFAIRGLGLIRGGVDGLTDLARIPVKEFEGTVVRIGDVARAEFGGEIRQGAVSMSHRQEDGSPVQNGEIVVGIVLKRFDANTASTIDGVRDRIAYIQELLPKGVTIESVYDQSALVDSSIRAVVMAVLAAISVVAFVLSLMIASPIAVILVLLSIPVSVACALLFSEATGLTANLISLGGLAIGIGILVDASVVMMEDIYRRVSESKSNEIEPDQLVLSSVRLIAKPLVAALLALLAVLTPLLWMPGVGGEMFAPMLLTLIAAEVAALAFALVVLPGLAVIWVRRQSRRPLTRSNPLQRFENHYANGLRWLVSRPAWITDGLIVGAIVIVVLLPRVETEFVPELDEGALSVRAVLPPTVSLESSLEFAAKLEAELMELSYVKAAISHIGRGEVGGDPEPVSNIEVLVSFRESMKVPDLNQVKREVETRLARFPGVNFSVSQPIAVRFDEMLSGVQSDVAIKIFGEDLGELEHLAQQVEQIVVDTPGTSVVLQEPLAGDTQLTITPNRDKLARHGVAVADVLRLISTAVGGIEAGEVLEGDRRFAIYARLDEPYRNSVEAIGRLIIRSSTGRWVRLSDISTIEFVNAPLQIRRDGLQRRAVVQFNVSGRALGTVVSEVRQRLDAELTLAPGYGIRIDGLHQLQQESRRFLSWMVPASLAAISMILSIGFGCWRRAALVMCTVPFALSGGVLALVLSGTYLSVPSGIGFIVVFGIGLLNATVMVVALDHEWTETADLNEGVVRGACQRMRPVLMTAATTIFGLIPLILSTGIGSELQKPLAITVAGGMLTATLLTLFATPALYSRWISNAA